MTDTFHIYGPPGCGKTTTLARQANLAIEKHGADRVVFSSLTKASANEMRSRGLPLMDDRIGTLHSLCFHQLGIKHNEVADTPKKLKEWNGSVNPSLQVNPKMGTTFEDIFSGGDTEEREGDKAFKEMQINRARMLPEKKWKKSTLYFFKEWTAWKKANGYTDFTGMIERALEETDYAPGDPKILFGDECQDYSKLEITLLRDHWGKRAEKVLLAGDPDQAIFEWRGADPKVFIDHPIPEENKRFLKQSYRLPKIPHAKALKWIRQIKNREDVEFKPREGNGSVSFLPTGYKEPEEIVRVIEREISEDRTVMVIGSCRYMLTPLIKQLKAKYIPFWNPYSTDPIWNPLKTKKNEIWGIDRVLSFLRPDPDTYGSEARDWNSKEMRTWMAILHSGGLLERGVKSLIADEDWGCPPTIKDFENLFLKPEFAHNAINTDLNWFKQNVTKLGLNQIKFPAGVALRHGGKRLMERPKVVVGTIHSVKGGEADTVIVFPDLAWVEQRTIEESRSEEEKMIRKFYVAITRTKDKLFICEPQDSRQLVYADLL